MDPKLVYGFSAVGSFILAVLALIFDETFSTGCFLAGTAIFSACLVYTCIKDNQPEE